MATATCSDRKTRAPRTSWMGGLACPYLGLVIVVGEAKGLGTVINYRWASTTTVILVVAPKQGIDAALVFVSPCTRIQPRSHGASLSAPARLDYQDRTQQPNSSGERARLEERCTPGFDEEDLTNCWKLPDGMLGEDAKECELNPNYANLWESFSSSIFVCCATSCAWVMSFVVVAVFVVALSVDGKPFRSLCLSSPFVCQYSVPSVCLPPRYIYISKRAASKPQCHTPTRAWFRSGTPRQGSTGFDRGNAKTNRNTIPERKTQPPQRAFPRTVSPT